MLPEQDANHQWPFSSSASTSDTAAATNSKTQEEEASSLSCKKHQDTLMSFDWTLKLNMRRKCCRFFSPSSNELQIATSNERQVQPTTKNSIQDQDCTQLRVACDDETKISNSDQEATCCPIQSNLMRNQRQVNREDNLTLSLDSYGERNPRNSDAENINRNSNERKVDRQDGEQLFATAHRAEDNLSALSASSSLLSQLLNSSLNQLIEIDNGSSTGGQGSANEEQQASRLQIDERDLSVRRSSSIGQESAARNRHRRHRLSSRGHSDAAAESRRRRLTGACGPPSERSARCCSSLTTTTSPSTRTVSSTSSYTSGGSAELSKLVQMNSASGVRQRPTTATTCRSSNKHHTAHHCPLPSIERLSSMADAIRSEAYKVQHQLASPINLATQQCDNDNDDTALNLLVQPTPLRLDIGCISCPPELELVSSSAAKASNKQQEFDSYRNTDSTKLKPERLINEPTAQAQVQTQSQQANQLQQHDSLLEVSDNFQLQPQLPMECCRLESCPTCLEIETHSLAFRSAISTQQSTQQQQHQQQANVIINNKQISSISTCSSSSGGSSCAIRVTATDSSDSDQQLAIQKQQQQQQVALQEEEDEELGWIFDNSRKSVTHCANFRQLVLPQQLLSNYAAKEPIFGLDPRTLPAAGLSNNQTNTSQAQANNLGGNAKTADEFNDKSSIVEARAKLARVVEWSQSCSPTCSRSDSTHQVPVLTKYRPKTPLESNEEPIYDVPAQELRCLSPDQKYPGSALEDEEVKEKEKADNEKRHATSCYWTATSNQRPNEDMSKRCSCSRCINKLQELRRQPVAPGKRHGNHLRILRLNAPGRADSAHQLGSQVSRAATYGSSPGYLIKQRRRRQELRKNSTCSSDSCSYFFPSRRTKRRTMKRRERDYCFCHQLTVTSSSNSSSSSRFRCIQCDGSVVSSSSSGGSCCCHSVSSSSSSTGDSSSQGTDYTPGSLTQEYLRRHKWARNRSKNRNRNRNRKGTRLVRKHCSSSHGRYARKRHQQTETNAVTERTGALPSSGRSGSRRSRSRRRPGGEQTSHFRDSYSLQKYERSDANVMGRKHAKETARLREQETSEIPVKPLARRIRSSSPARQHELPNNHDLQHPRVRSRAKVNHFRPASSASGAAHLLRARRVNDDDGADRERVINSQNLEKQTDSTTADRLVAESDDVTAVKSRIFNDLSASRIASQRAACELFEQPRRLKVKQVSTNYRSHAAIRQHRRRWKARLRIQPVARHSPEAELRSERSSSEQPPHSHHHHTGRLGRRTGHNSRGSQSRPHRHHHYHRQQYHRRSRTARHSHLRQAHISRRVSSCQRCYTKRTARRYMNRMTAGTSCDTYSSLTAHLTRANNLDISDRQQRRILEKLAKLLARKSEHKAEQQSELHKRQAKQMSVRDNERKLLPFLSRETTGEQKLAHHHLQQQQQHPVDRTLSKRARFRKRKTKGYPLRFGCLQRRKSTSYSLTTTSKSNSLASVSLGRTRRHLYYHQQRSAATLNQMRAMQKALIASSNQRKAALTTENPQVPTSHLFPSNEHNINNSHEQQLMNKFLVKTLIPPSASISKDNPFAWQLSKRCQCSHCCLVERFILMDAEAKLKRKTARKLEKQCHLVPAKIFN